jgi:hypothetical protein
VDAVDATVEATDHVPRSGGPATAPRAQSAAVLAVVVLAAVIVLPGFVLLYVLDQRGLLPEEGVDDMADRAPDRRARQQPATAIGHDRRQH